ncbi:MAG: glucose-6-phosphate dehydrogenase assembly protein OpcA [Actinomycetota bacterium]|nr:glucose-6-phosphate dehydrogenase assembly protein OpcA [Actinomycetota bacterium]
MTPAAGAARPPVRAGMVTVGTWRDDAASMGSVLSALDDLRCRDHRGAVRTSFLTLLVVGDAATDVDDLFDTVHGLGENQPSRVVALRLLPGDERRLAARVGVHLLPRGDQCLGIDDVALELSGEVTSHLDSVVEPLTLPDLPVVVWCCKEHPDAEDALVRTADHVVVDSAASRGRAGLGQLYRLRRRVVVTDFAWLRLLRLRRHLAAVVRRPELRPLLDRVSVATVGGTELDRALLAGWLADRLPAARVDHGARTGRPSIALAAGEASITVEQAADSVTASVVEGDQPAWESTMGAPPATTEGLLASALLQLRPDPVFDGALATAAGRGDT